jgi:hypothetical protein
MVATVVPETFTLVQFDAARIRAVIEQLLPDVGLAPDVDVTVQVDEGVPMGRAEVVSVDPIVVEVEGGAFEDPKRPRQLSEAGTADVLGRLLLRVRDRRDPAFGDPPPDAELTLAHRVAWDVHCVGRLARRGYRAQRQRRLYGSHDPRLRRRGGRRLDALDAEQLTWPEIVRSAMRVALAGRHGLNGRTNSNDPALSAEVVR